MKLVHHSELPLGELHNKDNLARIHSKPRGLWLSDEDAEWNWHIWCHENDFALDCFKYKAEFTLSEDHNILIVDSDEAMEMFHKKYNDTSSYYGRGVGGIGGYRINWEPVAHDFQGIIITPYLGAFRLHSEIEWYYTWDCASGCIWDVSAIERIA